MGKLDDFTNSFENKLNSIAEKVGEKFLEIQNNAKGAADAVDGFSKIAERGLNNAEKECSDLVEALVRTRTSLKKLGDDTTYVNGIIDDVRVLRDIAKVNGQLREQQTKRILILKNELKVIQDIIALKNNQINKEKELNNAKKQPPG